MRLKHITQKLFDLLQKNWSSYSSLEQQIMGQQLDEYVNLFLTLVDAEYSSEQLISILELEKNHFFLPIPCVFRLYQRLLTITKINTTIYKEFADYLKLYGPDWEKEAEQINRLIDGGELRHINVPWVLTIIRNLIDH